MKRSLIVCIALAWFVMAPGLSMASESLNYRCNLGDQFVFIYTIPEEGRAVYSELSGEVPLVPSARGGYWNDAMEISFNADGAAPTLWLGDVSHVCQIVTPGTGRPAQATSTAAGSRPVSGRSLGGKLRSGPGTHYAQSGSLAEGAPVTILANTGVRYDGYDWFEIKTDNGRHGYQWGGIMCSENQTTPGVFMSCQDWQSQRAGRQQAQLQSTGAGWMAFATAPNGAFGHGAAPSRSGAEQFAMNYCARSDCRIADVTQAKCHALAVAPGATGIGAGQTPESANNFALGWCSNSGTKSCRIEYTYCQ